MESLFKEALDYIKNLPTERFILINSAAKGSPSITNDDKLTFYALFKQATAGPNNTKAPSKFKIVERYKWQAYQKLGKMSKQQAMAAYVQKLSKLAPNWNAKPKL